MQTAQQIVEAIKTLNININDATTQKLVETIVPAIDHIIWYQVFRISLVSIVVSGLIITVATMIYKSANKNNN